MIPYNSFEFNGINSMDNGVYISGDAVFNAPERDVEMIVIPGRNGEFIRDNGRFNNIEVTYPCGMFGDNDYAFRTKLRQFRNMLAGQTGYQRLVDTYNPDEYRLAVFKDAVEVEPAALNTAGQFEVIFNCKPQRFLMSGESSIEVQSGDSISNPTPFDAQPMVMTEGYGTLTVNGYEIEITSDPIGEVLLLNGGEELVNSDSVTKTYTIDTSLLDNGDGISVSSFEEECHVRRANQTSSMTIGTATAVNGEIQTEAADSYTYRVLMQLENSNLLFNKGTSKTVTGTFTIPLTYTKSGTDYNKTISVTISLSYDGANTFTASHSYTNSSYYQGYSTYARYFDYGDIIGDSTKSSLGHPTYIDCELGEVYKIESGSYVSLNHLTDLGSNLPVLSPGENEITFDNTFTSVEIIPHWWVV